VDGTSVTNRDKSNRATNRTGKFLERLFKRGAQISP
jgi:hypothetical protein